MLNSVIRNMLLELALLLTLTSLVYLSAKYLWFASQRSCMKDILRFKLLQDFDRASDSFKEELASISVPHKVMQSVRATAAEQLERLIPVTGIFIEAGYDPKDAVFIGYPVDYVIFKGRARGFIEEVIFLEVKTNSRNYLEENESQIKHILQGNRSVKWDRIDATKNQRLITRDQVYACMGATDYKPKLKYVLDEKVEKLKRKLLLK